MNKTNTYFNRFSFSGRLKIIFIFTNSIVYICSFSLLEIITHAHAQHAAVGGATQWRHMTGISQITVVHSPTSVFFHYYHQPTGRRRRTRMSHQTGIQGKILYDI